MSHKKYQITCLGFISFQQLMLKGCNKLTIITKKLKKKVIHCMEEAVPLRRWIALAKAELPFVHTFPKLKLSTSVTCSIKCSSQARSL